MKSLVWRKEPGSAVQAPISHGGSSHDYVISHRPGQHNVSYRPPGKHVHVGTYATEREARAAAAAHAAGGSPVPEAPARFVPSPKTKASKKPSSSGRARKSGRQLNREIASSLAASGQPGLAAIFASPEGRKEFAKEMRHQIQTQQASARNAEVLARLPFAAKRMISETAGEVVGNYATLDAAIAKAKEIGGWVIKRSDDSVVWGEDPRRAHSTMKSPTTVRYLYVLTLHSNKGTKLAELTGDRDDRGNAWARLWNAAQRKWQKGKHLVNFKHGYFIDERPAREADLKHYGFTLPAGHYLAG